MQLTTTNYFDQVKKVDFAKLPLAIQKTHDLVKKVGTGSEPWANYQASAQIRQTIDTYFGIMGGLLDKNPQWQVKQAPAPKPAKEPKPAKPAATPKAAATKKTVAPKPAKEKRPEIEYFNAKGKLVKGHVDPDKLYYLQPDGSYEQNGDGRSPGYVKAPKPKKEKAAKAPKAPKAPKPKKQKPVDTREQVPHLSPEVKYAQKFLRLVDHPATVEQIRALHRSLEKDITKRAVRVSSKHASQLDEVARLVAATYERMSEGNIGSVSKLEFDSPAVKWARDLVASQRVATATNLLSRFINMQGTVPAAKAVASLQRALENEYEENPEGEFALAVGAASAVLKDWKEGKPVRVTKQQLSGLNGLLGLSGLGCPDTPAKPCGCAKKAGR